MKKQYFKIKKAHGPWLEAEINKGNVFFDTHNGYRGVSGRQMIDCGPYREPGFSHDAMPLTEVKRLIECYGCVYWRNVL